MTSPSDEAPDLDALIAELRARVQRRRAEGVYPPGLEESLDAHFERLVGGRPPGAPQIADRLRRVLGELERFHFTRAAIDPSSDLPGGELVHRLVGKAVSRPVSGVLAQAEQHAALVREALALVGDLATTIAQEYDTRVVQQLDDLQVRLVEAERAIVDADGRREELARRVPGATLDPFYREDHFTAHFRGPAEDLRERYRDVAAWFAGSDVVLEIGFGRGELLELLAESGVHARGIEPDPELVATARGRGLDVEVGTAVEYLRGLDDLSLGGIVMVQVIEHLSPQHVIDVVHLASEKLRHGGKLYVETVNPTSLYTYAHAFWVDPDHVRPVHPAFLEFLLNEAGFTDLYRQDRSPVPPDEALELLPGDDELTKRLNANFERVNALLFAPQDYAYFAVRP